MEQHLIWIIAGILLVMAEFAVPGLIVIFFGISALVVGLALALGMPAGGGLPYILFSVLSVAQIFLLRRMFKAWFMGSTLENAAQLEEFIGREAIVVSGFEDDAVRGQVEFKGTNWMARIETPGASLQAGDRVRITAREGLTLTITSIT